MNRTVFIIIASIIVFGLTTYFTADEKREVDGQNIYGFPLTFYIQPPTAQLAIGSKPKPDIIIYWKLVLDILFSFVIGYLIIKIFKRFVPSRI